MLRNEHPLGIRRSPQPRFALTQSPVCLPLRLPRHLHSGARAAGAASVWSVAPESWVALSSCWAPAPGHFCSHSLSQMAEQVTRPSWRQGTASGGAVGPWPWGRELLETRAPPATSVTSVRDGLCRGSAPATSLTHTLSPRCLLFPPFGRRGTEDRGGRLVWYPRRDL